MFSPILCVRYFKSYERIFDIIFWSSGAVPRDNQLYLCCDLDHNMDLKFFCRIFLLVEANRIGRKLVLSKNKTKSYAED